MIIIHLLKFTLLLCNKALIITPILHNIAPSFTVLKKAFHSLHVFNFRPHISTPSPSFLPFYSIPAPIPYIFIYNTSHPCVSIHGHMFHFCTRIFTDFLPFPLVRPSLSTPATLPPFYPAGPPRALPHLPPDAS